MNAAGSSSGSASATRQPSEQSTYSELPEAEFLAHEAELAKRALTGALAELKTDLAKAGDVKLWAHHYPWLTVGVAAATGFTLAAITKSSGPHGARTEDEESARQRLLRETAKAPYNSHAAGTKPKLGESLLGTLFSLARTALEASLVSAIRAEGAERAGGSTSACPSTTATQSGSEPAT